MDVNPVRNIAPFIFKEFTVTSAWWVERWGTIHKGLDIATGANDNVYSMLDGYVVDVGGSPDTSTGYYIIIANNDQQSGFYGVATRYLHLKELPSFQVHDRVQLGQKVGVEGDTGTGVTGIHLHVEMQNIAIRDWRWTPSNRKEDYMDPTTFMGIDNVEGTKWIYYGRIVPSSRKHGFKWVLYSRILRNKRKLQ